ncbi:MAG: FKBP-type peptidyl-prolyl cis-trans isomerase [archaeon]
MTNEKKAKKGDKVSVEFVGKLEDGTVFDKVPENSPFTFELGNSDVLKTFQEEIVGMKEDEIKEFTIPKEKAYGKKDKKLIFEMTKEVLGDNEFKKGDIVSLKSPKGDMPAKILEVKEDKVTIDTNPILAGHDLTYKVRLIEIKRK